MSSLESVFNDGDPEVIESVEAEPEAPEIVEEPESVEKEEVSTTEPEAEKEHQNVPIQALKAEREKRQALERQMAEFQKEKTPAPDVFEDQSAYTEHLQTEFNQALFNERANMSEFYARREFTDLDDKIETFQALTASNPALTAQVQNAVSPYHEIVDIVKKWKRCKTSMSLKQRLEPKLRQRSEQS